MPSFAWSPSVLGHQPSWLLRCLLLLAWICASVTHGMTDDQLRGLRHEVTDLFYHGFDNYMDHAFPEDELKPLSCEPLTRDRANPAHIEVNDVLGNYSLTLIDSLSTLAILASSPEPLPNGRDPWIDFQNGIEALIDLYGDGTNTTAGQGKRSRGFDQDSKVQVFETVIRGVGGLVSAHLFAVGELPVRRRAVRNSGLAGLWGRGGKSESVPRWSNGFQYDGQLLRLAVDLADRLVPAFYTATGLPYPRVNLRYGVPFYQNSPLNTHSLDGVCEKEPTDQSEITETCSAGAGSLVLEFTTLSRLTGIPLYEELAKEAFWAVWERRSDLDLLGSGVDAETGQWVSSYAGIGAGIDSFFEYALKSHILLSSSSSSSDQDSVSSVDNRDSFLSVWQDAHAGIKRHLYRGASYQHPHYIQGDLLTGASKAYWIDSLSAFYPGLLALAGELEEASETHLLYTALWTRYAALPERWSTATSSIDAGLRWWGGRPEFIESTWYLYRATQDPYYLHVGEMTLQDIKRRCWTECGWAGLEDVRTGELKDRMESFFLGETAKYLYLLFDTGHPLNKLDAPFVFTTEGHPLVLPKVSQQQMRKPKVKLQAMRETVDIIDVETCQLPPSRLPFSISNVASRQDLFHAAGLARLHLVGGTQGVDSEVPLVESSYNADTYAEAVRRSPNNYTFYPWTLPAEYIPYNGMSSKMQMRETFDLSFPTLENTSPGNLFITRVEEGVVINAVSGLELGLIKEPGFVDGIGLTEVYRVHAVGRLNLGKDEKVFVSSKTVAPLNPVDEYFTRHKDMGVLDLVLAMPLDDADATIAHGDEPANDGVASANNSQDDLVDEDMIFFPTDIHREDLIADMNLATQSQNNTENAVEQAVEHNGILSALMQHLQHTFDPSNPSANPVVNLIQQAQQHLQSSQSNTATASEVHQRPALPAALATGPGAAPPPAVPDASLTPSNSKKEEHFFTKIHILDSTLCEPHHQVPLSIIQQTHVLVIKRGDCSFSSKLRQIPSFPPSSNGLQLLIIVSFPSHEERDTKAAHSDGQGEKGGVAGEAVLVRPHLDEEQLTPGGLRRMNDIPVLLVGGGEETLRMLRQAKGVGLRRRFWYETKGVRISNLYVI